MDNISKQNPYYSFIFFLLIFLTVINIVILWQAKYLSFQDHPSHLLRNFILLNLHNPQYDFGEHFIANWTVIPNLSADLITMFFGLFFPIATAAKIFYSIYIISFPLALFFYLSNINKEQCVYSLLAAPFTFNAFLFHGNENFIISIPVLLVFLGYLYKHEEERSIRSNLILIFLSLVLYFSHILSFLICFVIVLLSGCLKVKSNLKNCFKNVSLFIPGLIMFIIWASGAFIIEHAGKHYEGQIFIYGSPMQNLKAIFDSLAGPFAYIIILAEQVHFFNLINLMKFICSYFILILFILGVGRAVNKNVRAKVLFVLFLIGFILPWWFVLFAPGQRLIFFLIIIGTVFFPRNRLVKRIFMVFILCFTLLVQGSVLNNFKILNGLMAPVIQSLRKLPKRQVVLPLVLSAYAPVYCLQQIHEYYH